MKADKGCVYLLRNLVNGKGYVGQHCTLEPEKYRWAQHIDAANAGKKRTPEQRERQAIAAKKRWAAAGYVPRTEWKRSEETRRNMAEARRKTWATKLPAERAAITVKALATKAQNAAARGV